MDAHSNPSPYSSQQPLPPGVTVQGNPSGAGVNVIIQQAPQPRKGVWGILGWLLKTGMYLLPFLVVLGLFGAGNMNPGELPINERFHSRDKMATDKIAIIRIEGSILEGEGYPRKQIDRVLKDEEVKAIVLRVDSPGGTVTASDYILHHLKKLREERDIPLITSMGSLAASGGYYVAMAVGDQPKSIYAEPTTWTGSIGVIIPHYDLSGLLSKLEVGEDSIASHRLKGMGNPAKKMTEEERQIFQTLVDESFLRFKQIVKDGRPAFRSEEGEKRLAEVATGQVFTADQAKANGLVDEIGFLEDAIDQAAKSAGLDPSKVRVVDYESPKSLQSILFGLSPSQRRGEIEMLMDRLSPRAYYLFTWPSASAP